MTRSPLPHRRPNLTETVDWQGHVLTVTVGLRPDSLAVAEVFASTTAGGALQDTLSDACVLISIALQHGITPKALTHSMGRIPLWRETAWGEGPSSPVGAIADAVAQIATTIPAMVGETVEAAE